MSRSLFPGVRNRLRTSLRPRVLAGSLLTSVVVVAAMPIIAIGLLFLVSLAAPELMTTSPGALALGAISTVVFYGVAGLTLLFGVLLSAFVHAGAHANDRRLLRVSWVRTIRAFPRLVVGLTAFSAAFVVATAFWPLLSLGLLIAAVARSVRAARTGWTSPEVPRSGLRGAWQRVTPGSRRTLVWAIPLMPALAAAALVVAVLPASLASPGSLRQLAGLAWSRVRGNAAELLGYLVVAGLLATLASVGGISAADGFDPSNSPEITGATTASLAVLVAAVVLLQVCVGATVAIFTSGATTRAPGLPERASIRSIGAIMSRRTRPLAGRVAMVLIMALITTIAPLPAFANDPNNPALAGQAAAALTLTVDGVDGSPLITADVRVAGADAAGLVQFLDGTTTLGEPVTLVSDPAEPELFTAVLAPLPVLTAGSHDLSFVYAPVSDTVATAHSEATTYVVGQTGGAENLFPDITEPATPMAAAAQPAAPADDAANAEPVTDASAQRAPAVTDELTVTSGSVGGAVTLGEYFDIGASVTAPNAPSGTVVPGRVNVYAGALHLGEIDQTPSGTYTPFATDGLTAGDVQLRFEYVAQTGFAASEGFLDITVEKARTSFSAHTIVPDDYEMTWGDTHTVTATVRSSVDEPRVLELLALVGGTAEVLATVDFDIVNGEADVIADFTGLLPGGTSYYTLRVAETAQAATGNIGDYFAKSISPAATVTSLAVVDGAGLPTQGHVAEPLTITATVTSPATSTTPTDGAVRFSSPDVQLGIAQVNAQGVASITFTPDRRKTYTITGEFLGNTAGAYASSSATVTASPDGANTGAPTAGWSGALTLTDTWLSVAYPSTAALGAPTGTISILDESGAPVAITVGSDAPRTQFALSAGSIRLAVPAPVGASAYRIAYSGDLDYTPRTDALPPVVVSPPVVTLTAQTPAYYSQETFFTVQVTDVPLDTVRSVTVYETNAQGSRSAVGTVVFDTSTGGGYLYGTLRSTGVAVLTAEVLFTTASDLATVSSVPQNVNIPEPFAPDVRLSVDSSLVLDSGRRRVEVTVTAHSGGRVVDVASGTVAVIRDDAGDIVGSVTLTGNANPSGTGYVTLSRSSTTGLVATVPYGPFSSLATSPLTALPSPERDTSTTLTVAPSVSNGVATIALTARVSGTPLDTTRSVIVVVALNGVRKTVTLNRSETVIDQGWLGTIATFDGEAVFADLDAGSNLLRVTGTGNGADVDAIDYTTSLFVARHSTVLSVSGYAAAAAGTALTVSTAVTAVEPGGTVPTGTVTLTLAPAYVSCQAPVGASCTFPAEAVRGGKNTVTASYAGDSENSPSATTVDFSVAMRTTDLTVDFSVDPSRWIVGESVTATWTTATSLRAAVGRVTVRAGAASCEGAAAAGQCTFTVVTGSPWTTARDQPYTVTFTSSDDAPNRTVSGLASPQSCYVVASYDAVVDTTGATTCVTKGASGVLAGSTVTLTTEPLPTHYVFGTWSIDGEDTAGITTSGRTTTFIVTRSGIYGYSTTYAPTCYTLTVSPNAEIADGSTTLDAVKGRIIVFTKPNCTSPTTPSAADLAELDAGHPRYAAGTIVESLASGNYLGGEVTDRSSYAVDTFTGVSRQSGVFAFGRTTMSRDSTIAATFAVPTCYPFSLVQGTGGTASIASATRPASSGSLEPATGACVRDGVPGYVPGTSIDIETLPDAGSSFLRLAQANGVPTADELKLVALTTEPTTAGPTLTTIVLNQDAGSRAYPVFGRKDCVSVTVRVIGPEAELRYGNSVKLYGADGANECAPPTTRKPKLESLYSTLETTYSVLASATLSLQTKQDRLQYDNHPWGSEGANVTWGVSYGTTTVTSDSLWSGSRSSSSYPVVNSTGRDGTTSGPRVNLSELPPTERTVLLTATYAMASCATPTVYNPFNAPYQVRVIWSSVPACKELNQGTKHQFLELRAANSVVPGLFPIFSRAGGSSNDGRDYLGNPAVVGNTAVVALEYCVPLNLTVKMRDDKNTVRVLPESEAKHLILDNGGCPPMHTRPGGTVTTALTAEAAYYYSIVSTPATMPVFEVDDRGVSANATIELKPNCVTVQAGTRTHRTTPSNCPGGNDNRYFKGTVVQLWGDVHDDEGLDGWWGVDDQNGVNALVVAETDRSVEVDIDYPSKWETFTNGLSNFAQRIASAAVIVATGVLLAKMMLAKMVTLALKGLGTVVSVLGGGDGMLNAMTKLDNGVSAMINTVKLFSTCINTGAKGKGTLTAIPSGTLGTGGAAATEGGLKVATGAVGLYGQYLKDGESKTAGNVAVAVASARTMVDLFGSNTSLYGQSAGAAWTSMGSGLGGCMADGLEDNAHLLLSHEKE